MSECLSVQGAASDSRIMCSIDLMGGGALTQVYFPLPPISFILALHPTKQQLFKTEFRGFFPRKFLYWRIAAVIYR